MHLRQVGDLAKRVIDAVAQVIVGKDGVLRQVLMGILSDGHILIQDNPGLAKTLIAHSFSEVLDIAYSRIQFTPDLLPGEITGGYIYNQREAQFEFRRGPLFANLLLGDEINRATPKTQSALLEAMQERQVTVEGERFPLDPPFIVIATQNPVEFEGTYPLPEAQLDRFIMRISVGYPDAEQELEILLRRQQRKQDTVSLQPVVSHQDLLAMQRALEEVHVSEAIGKYIVDLARATREDNRTEVGASPRGVFAVFKLARAAAVLDNRDFATPEDVRAWPASPWRTACCCREYGCAAFPRGHRPGAPPAAAAGILGARRFRLGGGRRVEFGADPAGRLPGHPAPLTAKPPLAALAAAGDAV